MSQQHYLGNKKPTFFACNPEKVYAAILEFSKNDLLQTTKSTPAAYMKFPAISLTWFCKNANVMCVNVK